MTRARTALGALAICALGVCAFGVQGASAKGMTAVTCVEGKGTPEFNNSHCESELAGGGWITQDIPLNETTELEGESVTPAVNVLHATLAGLSLTVTCAMSTGTGDVKNITPEVGGTMFAHGTNIVIDYTGCHAVLTSNPEKTCEVEDVATAQKNTIRTNPLTAITSETEHELVVKAEVPPTPIAKFKILSGPAPCFITKTIEVTVTGEVTGKIPTTKPSHVTFEGTGGSKLLANGQVASYTATHNAWMKGEPERTIAAETR